MNNHNKNRVPEIALAYWLIKIASTTLGETGADMFSMTYDIGYLITSILFLIIFLVFLLYKLKIKEYSPISYWLTFTATSIVGTAISDFLDRTMHMGYAGGSLLLISLLLVILFIWYREEKTLSVENITTSKAEIFYWLAFLIANTLGTAAGDFLADDTGLGFAGGAAVITGLLLIITALHYLTRINSVILFWLAFVLTRPFGATFGDFLTKPLEHGGLNLGTIDASAFFAIVLYILIHKEHRGHKRKNVYNKYES